MSVAVPSSRRDRVRRFARAALKQALGVVTGDRRLEAEGAAERAAERPAAPAAGAGVSGAAVSGAGAERPGRRGARGRTEKRDAR